MNKKSFSSSEYMILLSASTIVVLVYLFFTRSGIATGGY